MKPTSLRYHPKTSHTYRYAEIIPYQLTLSQNYYWYHSQTESGKEVIVLLQGRYIGKKAAVDETFNTHKFSHDLIVGIAYGPRKEVICGTTIAVDHQPAGQSSTWSEVNASGEILPARSVIIEGVLYIFGGYGGGTDRLDNFYSFSFEENEWREVEVLSNERPGCRENNGVVWSKLDGGVVMIGIYMLLM